MDDAPITVVLADDHAVVRSGLRLLLAQDGMEVVAEAGDVESALRYVLGHKPDVLVLDLNMPGEPSLPAIPRFLEASPETRIVVLTMQEDPQFAREALGSGAAAYVLKEAADDELVQAIHAARDGRTYVNPSLGREARDRADRPAGRADRPRGRHPAADRARPHEHRDRRAALPQRPHGRDAPRAHPAEARPDDAGRARALRARQGPRRLGAGAARARAGQHGAHRRPGRARRDLERAARERRALAHARQPEARSSRRRGRTRARRRRRSTATWPASRRAPDARATTRPRAS